MAVLMGAAIERFYVFESSEELRGYINFLRRNKVKYQVLEDLPFKDGRRQVVLRQQERSEPFLENQHL